jgi:chromosome segregation ATPase
MADQVTVNVIDRDAENDMLARQLHDKATRGGALTPTEEATLEAWYKRQDAEENALLASATPQAATLRNLRSEVEAASAQMLAVTQHIQTLIAENEALRQEIATLSQQLARAASLQAA